MIYDNLSEYALATFIDHECKMIPIGDLKTQYDKTKRESHINRDTKLVDFIIQSFNSNNSIINSDEQSLKSPKDHMELCYLLM